MDSKAFQLHKVKRAIVLSGTEYQFKRNNLNTYNEPDGTTSDVALIKGLWHESQGYITTTKSDSATVRSKPSPQIMSLWEGAKELKQGDLLEVGSNQYTVTGVHNLCDAGVVADISLEVSV